MYSPTYYMQQVLTLARMTPWQTRPNPQVAALIVKNQQIVGMGIHLGAGLAHAEIIALQQAQEQARGASLYINLEPCTHYGRTPPCVDAVIKAGISEVYIASSDPNPLVAGRGIAQLRQAGIKVEVGLCQDEERILNQVFWQNMQAQKPYVTIKAGVSLDGRIATKSNCSQWITSLAARQDAHQYRISHEAILVGVATVITDNPSLTPHLITNPSRQPIRIILDRNLRLPLNAKVVTDNAAPTWIYTTVVDSDYYAPYQAQGCQVHHLKDLTIEAVLTDLYQRGIYSLLVEGGEQVYSSFFDSGLINQLVCYYSPQLIGSISAKHLFAGNGYTDLIHNLKLSISEVKQLDRDLKVVSQIVRN